MTLHEQDIYWIKFNSFQQRMERKYTPLLTTAIKHQISYYIQTGKAHSIPSEPIYKVLKNLYIEVGTKWAHQTFLHIRHQKARMPMGFSERIIDLMRTYYGIDLINESDLMTKEVRAFIAEVLSDAAAEGFGIDEIVKRLTTDATLPAMKARRIARTEVVTAANAASHIQAKESGLALNKIWISVRDKRTRHSHKIEDNTIVDIDIPFTVGDEETKMMSPGAVFQPNGLRVPAKERINCRCVEAHIPKVDRNGNLIRT